MIKILFQKLFYSFDVLPGATSAWLVSHASSRKRTSSRESSKILTPDCINIRGGASKKNSGNRLSPAP
jgi:hypothetical protein